MRLLTPFALAPFALAAGIAIAQTTGPATPSGVKRTILQRVDVPGTNFETILGVAEIAAGSSTGRHTHGGPETGTVIEGELILVIEGQPDRTLKPGDSYQIPAGSVHDAKTGAAAGKVIAVYTVPKGLPLATPAK